MVDEKYINVLSQILELLDTACQASLELLEHFTSGKTDTARQLLTDLRSAAGVVGRAQEPLLPELEHAYTAEMLENVEDTLGDIERSIEGGNAKRAAMKMEFQLFPFLRQLREAFYFWGMIYPDKEAMKCYYQEEFAAHYQNFYVQDGNPHCTVSVVIVAYNHLEMTKQCVESVLKYTDFDALDAELILVDHGSTDGTQEYFESLGIGKVIHYKANMRGTMFCFLPQICDSKYYVHVANDAVVTKDWLNILLDCVRSDTKIALVSPATCNTSNLQGLHIPADREGLAGYAAIHNKKNPQLWCDRARVLPVIGVFNISILNEIGFWDPLFYTFDFMDDDFSFRARRSGFRQILCEDVVCYHRGSATVASEQAAERTLEEGRKLFAGKNGTDAWGNGFCYNLRMLQDIKIGGSNSVPAAVLGINCGFGDNVLHVRNQMRRMGQEGSIYNITTEPEFMPDLRPLSKSAVLTVPEQLAAAVENSFPDVSFSYVCVGWELNRFCSPYSLLEAISHRTGTHCQVFFQFDNPYFAVRLYQMLHFSVPETSRLLLPPDRVMAELGKWYSSVYLSAEKAPIQGLDEFVKRYYGADFSDSKEKVNLEISKYYIRCIK